MIPVYHQCEFCSKTFANEVNLSKHKCEFSKRHDYITKTGTGMIMYRLYIFWLRNLGRSTRYVDEHTFIHSIHYKAFVRFMEFSKKYSLPSNEIYIRYCNSRNLSPQAWTDKELYKEFLEWYDQSISYEKQLKISIQTVMQVCQLLELEKPSDIFDVLDGKIILELIRSRRISPWMIFNSECWMDYLAKKATAEERKHVHLYINPKRWGAIFSANPKKREAAIEIMKEFGL